MAKNRRIPFGYQMINGEITTHPREVYAVSKIFAEYLKGRSLLDISRELQSEGIPYHHCEDSTWNKNMIKRILENEKYLGTEIYPQIISPEIFHRANNKKLKKANNLCIVPDELKKIRNTAICAKCRKRLFRNQNGTWQCKTYRCGPFEFTAEATRQTVSLTGIPVCPSPMLSARATSITVPMYAKESPTTELSQWLKKRSLQGTTAAL